MRNRKSSSGLQTYLVAGSLALAGLGFAIKGGSDCYRHDSEKNNVLEEKAYNARQSRDFLLSLGFLLGSARMLGAYVSRLSFQEYKNLKQLKNIEKQAHTKESCDNPAHEGWH